MPGWTKPGSPIERSQKRMRSVHRILDPRMSTEFEKWIYRGSIVIYIFVCFSCDWNYLDWEGSKSFKKVIIGLFRSLHPLI